MNVLFALCFLMSPDRSAPLPEWSIPWITPALALAKQDRLPVEAQNHPVWRIYEQHSYLRKEGSLFCRVRLIQIVLNDDWGARNGQVLLGDSGQQGEILSAFGWHQAPNGRVERLKPEGIFYVGDGQTNNISQDQYTIAHFENLRRFSVVLVESTQKVERFLGPVFLVKPSDQAPTRYFEVDVPEEPLNQFRLLPFRMDTWSLEQKKSDRSWSLLNYPAPLSQAPCSNLPGDFPGIVVAFSDARYANWDAFAKWYVGIFAEAAQAGDLAAPTSAKPEIEAMIQKVAGNLYYRQVYLTAQRGWVPEPGAKVWQKGFGDCKDLVSACAFEAQQRQFTVLPVLASIGPSNRMKPDDPVFSGFNHLIGAIPLSQSLNLEAEVMVGDRRFLLFDPTQAHAPFGRLPRYYLDSDVLICTTQGGSWVHIEASMLEDNRYQVSINGQLTVQRPLANYNLRFKVIPTVLALFTAKTGLLFGTFYAIGPGHPRPCSPDAFASGCQPPQHPAFRLGLARFPDRGAQGHAVK